MQAKIDCSLRSKFSRCVLQASQSEFRLYTRPGRYATALWQATTSEPPAVQQQVQADMAKVGWRQWGRQQADSVLLLNKLVSGLVMLGFSPVRAHFH